MKKIKVADASGIVLDWLVAKCEGVAVEHLKTSDGLLNQLNFKKLSEARKYNDARYRPQYSPSQAWPIIDRERICVHAYLDPAEGWNACIYIGKVRRFHLGGSTGLIAAMRCYVASKLGEEAEVPEELLP